jgi:hypothetical protein
MKNIAWVLAASLLFAPLTQVFAAGKKLDDPANQIEKIKVKIARLGVGDKARATIKLQDGTRVKGYVHSAGDDDFVIRDEKTNASTTIRYAEVKSVDDMRGHSMARNILIAVGIGAAVTVIAIYSAIARNER